MCKLQAEQAGRILVGKCKSGLIQQLLYHCESGHIGMRYWVLRTQTNLCGLLWGLFVCPVQTRQNNGTLQEQPEVTAVKWLWWPWHRDVYREGKTYFFHYWRTIPDPEGGMTKDGVYLWLLFQLEMTLAMACSVLLQRQIKDFMSSKELNFISLQQLFLYLLCFSTGEVVY